MRSVRSNKGTRRDVCTCFSYTAKCTPLAALRVSVQSCFASWARVGTLRLPKSAGAGLRRGTRRGAPASGRVVLTLVSLPCLSGTVDDRFGAGQWSECTQYGGWGMRVAGWGALYNGRYYIYVTARSRTSVALRSERFMQAAPDRPPRFIFNTTIHRTSNTSPTCATEKPAPSGDTASRQLIRRSFAGDEFSSVKLRIWNSSRASLSVTLGRLFSRRGCAFDTTCIVESAVAGMDEWMQLGRSATTPPRVSARMPAAVAGMDGWMPRLRIGITQRSCSQLGASPSPPPPT